MVPKSTKAARGIPPRPASPALSYYSYDDDHTLYSSDSDAYSFSNVSTDSFSSIDTYANMRPFRLPKNQEHPSYAYEGWCLYLSPDDREVIRGSKILGFDVYQEYDQFRPHVNVSSEVYEQSELMDMHINALKRYDAKHKRCLPTRLLLGKGRKYEDELDERVRRLPNAIQDELNRLLADREDSSSNRFHYRAWEVVLMREQLHRRFADAEPTVAKKHRLRFWKNKGTETHPIEYFFIIRGRETRTPDDPNKGFKTYRRFDNPWEKSDAAEIRSRNRALWQKRRVERRGRYRRARAYRETRPPPRVRSRSPPATYRSRPSYPRRYPSLSPRPFHRTPMAPPPPPPPPAPAMPNYGLYPPAPSGPYVQRPPFFPTQPPPFPGPNTVNPPHPPYSPYAYPGYASATGPCGNPFGQRPAVSVTSGINGLSSTLPSYYPPGIPAPSWSPGHDPLQSARCTVCLTTLPCIHRPGYGGIPPPPPPIPQVRAPAVPRSCLNPRGPCMFLSGCALHLVREVPPANPPKFSGIPAARPPASVKHVSVEPTVNKIPRRPRSADSIRSRSRSRSPPSRPKLVEIESDEDQSIIEA